jgi:type III pantothenate kinase
LLLAIDIGNTNVVFGVFKDNSWKNVWRIQTGHGKTTDEYEVIFRSLFLAAGVNIDEIKRIVSSSVVPSLNDSFRQLSLNLTGQEMLVINPEIYHLLPIKTLNPHQIGTDLVANATAAFSLYKMPCMVIDFGTALTFTSLSATGEILGVSIAPGLGTALKSLAGNTAQLPHVQLAKPPSVLGKNTVHAIQSGIVIGYAGLVDRIIKKTEDELQQKLNIVATGGFSTFFSTQSSKIDHVAENLTLDGLRIICELVAGSKG